MLFPIIPRALLGSQYQGYRGLCQENVSILKLFFWGYGNRTLDCRNSQPGTLALGGGPQGMSVPTPGRVLGYSD